MKLLMPMFTFENIICRHFLLLFLSLGWRLLENKKKKKASVVLNSKPQGKFSSLSFPSACLSAYQKSFPPFFFSSGRIFFCPHSLLFSRPANSCLTCAFFFYSAVWLKILKASRWSWTCAPNPVRQVDVELTGLRTGAFSTRRRSFQRAEHTSHLPRGAPLGQTAPVNHKVGFLLCPAGRSQVLPLGSQPGRMFPNVTFHWTNRLFSVYTVVGLAACLSRPHWYTTVAGSQAWFS